MDHLKWLFEKFPDLKSCAQSIQAAYKVMETCYSQGGKLMICGNGGSAADSEHIAGELLKGFLLKRPIPEDFRRKIAAVFPSDADYIVDHLQGSLPAISLVSQVSFLTAYANDVAADMIFAQQVYAYGQAGDVLLGLSTSGNALNVVNAVRVARVLGVHTLSLTGKSGGNLRNLSEITIEVNWERTPDIQERHQAVYHTLCALLEERFFS